MNVLRQLSTAALAIALMSSVWIPTASAQAGDVDTGAEIYTKRCSQCHGSDGAADGPGANFMLPRPRVFKDNTSYKFRTTPSGELPTEQDIFNIISRGLPGTSMPGFDGLPEAERWDLVAYLRALAEDFEDEEMLEASEVLEEIDGAVAPEVTAESLERGKVLYQENKCWQCHGNTGRGNGPSFPTLKDDWSNPILPTNLTMKGTYRGGAEAFDVYRTMSTGLNGTPMPAYRDSITPEDRWALVHYILSLGPPLQTTTDETVKAAKVEQVPTNAEDEAWAIAPVARFKTLPNIIEPPRLFWSSVERVQVQALYDSDALALRIQWDDRTQSKGSNVAHRYADRDTTIYAGTDHPDQLAVQFPTRQKSATVRPYFLMGDGKRGVNLWWWQGDTNQVNERNAKGWTNQSTQPERDQQLEGSVAYDDGRYTMVLRRSLRTADAKSDVQIEPGTFVPISVHVWDGDRGEVGQRRSLTTWYWLYLRPPIPDQVYYVPPVAFAATFGFLLLLIAAVRRRREDETG